MKKKKDTSQNYLPTVSRRVNANKAAIPLNTDKITDIEPLLKLEITIYGAMKEPNFENEMQIA